MTKSYVVSVRMDDEDLERLNRLADATGMSRSAMIRFCLLFMDRYFARDLTLTEIIRPFPEIVEFLKRELKGKKS